MGNKRGENTNVPCRRQQTERGGWAQTDEPFLHGLLVMMGFQDRLQGNKLHGKQNKETDTQRSVRFQKLHHEQAHATPVAPHYVECGMRALLSLHRR